MRIDRLAGVAVLLGSLVPAVACVAGPSPAQPAGAEAPLRYEPFLLPYQPVEGAPGLLFSGYWNEPGPNGAGHWLLGGDLVPPESIGFAGPRGLVIADPGRSQRLVVQVGAPDPGPRPFVFDGLGGGVLHDTGRVSFGGTLRADKPGGTGVTGLFTGVRGDLNPVIFEGDAAPGTAPGVVFERKIDPKKGSVAEPAFGWLAPLGGDRVVFRGHLAGTGVNESNAFGLFEGEAGSLRLLAREGSQAPGAAPGVILEQMDYRPDSRNGRILFGARLAGAGVNESNDVALFVGTPDSLRPVAREGGAVPGLPGHTFVSEPWQSSYLMESGVFPLFAEVSEDATGVTRAGIWTGTAESMRPVMQLGDVAPGTGGEVFTAFGDTRINNRGDAAFFGYFPIELEGGQVGNDIGVFAGSPGGDVRLIAKRGDPRPGVGGEFSLASGWGPPAISDSGLVAFPTPEGVWATDPTGALLPVAISGQALEINGVTKVVDTARLDRFLDDGRLLVLLEFTDRRDGGLYAVTIVPEPATMAWVVGAIALLARRRGRGARSPRGLSGS